MNLKNYPDRVGINPVRHILLADDDDDDCEFFRQALTETGSLATLNIVNDGEELINFLNKAESLPDVLFMDLNMPRKTGLTCLLEIKANKLLALLPVIVLSTSNDPLKVQELYNNGMLRFFAKPNEFGQLATEIDTCLQLICKNMEVKN